MASSAKRLRGAAHTTFAALAVPNYRRYISGQAISLIGTWMQMAAQAWLVLTALVGCLAYEFQVSLPVMAREGLHVGAEGYGFMTAAMGVGAVAGGLVVAARGRTGLPTLILAAAGFALVLTRAALAPTLPLELLALALAGWASISFMATGNSTLQLSSEPTMRGRVMSLWFVAFQGSTPIGGPIVGFVMAQLGARAGLGLGAITCMVAAAMGLLVLRRLRPDYRLPSLRVGRAARNAEAEVK